MKHNKLLVLLVLPMMISACSPKAGFNTIEYEKTLDGTEKAVVIASIRAALAEKLVSVSGKMEGFYKTELGETKGSITSTATLNENGYVRTKTTQDITNTGAGQKQQRVEKSDIKIFQYDKGKFAKYGTDGDDFVFSTYASSEQDEYNDIINDVLGDLDSMTVAVDKKGNKMLFSSSKNESYTPITWGEKTKVIHSITKSQQYFEVAKDYTIKSSYTYQSQETNQDPDTGNVKDKVSKIMEVKYSYTYKYGTRASKDGEYQSELSEIRNTSYFAYAPNMSLGLYKGTDLVTTTSVSSIRAKRQALGKYQVTVQANVNSYHFESELADRVALQGTVGITKYNDAAPTEDAFFVPFTNFKNTVNFEASNTNYLLVKNLDNPVTLTISFVLAVEGTKAAVQADSVQVVIS